VGVADGDDFKAQLAEATSFLSQHSAALQRAATSPDFSAELDFGVWNGAPNAISQSFAFPLPLIALASQCSVELELSIYLASDP
jgi:hypothetical protein